MSFWALICIFAKKKLGRVITREKKKKNVDPCLPLECTVPGCAVSRVWSTTFRRNKKLKQALYDRLWREQSKTIALWTAEDQLQPGTTFESARAQSVCLLQIWSKNCYFVRNGVQIQNEGGTARSANGVGVADEGLDFFCHDRLQPR